MDEVWDPLYKCIHTDTQTYTQTQLPSELGLDHDPDVLVRSIDSAVCCCFPEQGTLLTLLQLIQMC